MIVIDQNFIDKLSLAAIKSERKRKNYNFHIHLDDLLQRLLNAFEPETYVRPHKHENPDKREVFIILRGRAAMLTFNDDGSLKKTVVLDRDAGVYGVEIPPRIWHTLVSLKTGTVLYEVKDGPYDVVTDKVFASWAPEENTPKTTEYLKELKQKIQA